MKDADALLTDLRNAYLMRFRLQMTARGEAEYICTLGMLDFLKRTIKEAGEMIQYLKKDRDSLMAILEDANADE